MRFLTGSSLSTAVLVSDIYNGFRSTAVAFNVSNRHIITLKSKVNVSKHLDFVQGLHASTKLRGFDGITHQYAIGGFHAYAAHLDDKVISQLRQQGDAITIEADQAWHSSEDRIELDESDMALPKHFELETPSEATQPQSSTSSSLIRQKLATWGLHHISHRDNSDAFAYWYDTSAGSGTFGYLVDTGIRVTHNEFQGRATLGYNAVDIVPFIDDSGHGTHNAGTMCGKSFGVAKNCSLIAVKVFHQDRTVLSICLDGYEWAVKDILNKGRRAKAVIYLSTSGPYTAAMNEAIDAASGLGVTTVVPAGNDGANTRNVSPASAKSAITIASVNFMRRRARRSNFGDDVDLFAPGHVVAGASSCNDKSWTCMSGTSVAAAFASGLALYFQGWKGVHSPRTTKDLLATVATAGVVGDSKSSKNLLAYNDCGK